MKEIALEKINKGVTFVKSHKWKFIIFFIIILFFILIPAMFPMSEEDKAKLARKKQIKDKISTYDDLYDSIESITDKDKLVQKLTYNILKNAEYDSTYDKKKLKFSSIDELVEFENEILSDPDSIYDNALLNFKNYISNINKYLEPMTPESIGLSPKERIIRSATKLYMSSTKETKLMRKYLDSINSLSSIVQESLSDGAKNTLLTYGATSMALLFSKS